MLARLEAVLLGDLLRISVRFVAQITWNTSRVAVYHNLTFTFDLSKKIFRKNCAVSVNKL